MPAHQHLDEMTRFDPSAARQIFEKVALETPADGWTLEIASGSTSDFAKKELEMIRRSWQLLGIELKTKYISDWAQFERYIQSDAVQLYRYAWNADLPDPDSFFHPLFASDSPVNFGGYADPKADQMISNALGIVDPVERAKKYQEIERYILNQYPIIPMFYLSIDRIYQPYVQDVHISALGAHTMPLNRVWFETKTGITAAD
jgi:ABC-type transport system substrate-binding protein